MRSQSNSQRLDAQEVMTTAEAAAFLQCSIQHLEISRVRGDGPPFSRLGRLVRYRKSALLRWLEKNEVTSTSAEVSQ